MRRVLLLFLFCFSFSNFVAGSSVTSQEYADFLNRMASSSEYRLYEDGTVLFQLLSTAEFSFSVVEMLHAVALLEKYQEGEVVFITRH